MYRDYLSINGTTIVSDEKGMHKKETNDKIGKELELENEIEIIETNIACLNHEKGKLGTVEKNKKAKRGIYIFGIFMLIFTVVLCKWGLPALSGVPEYVLSNPRFSFVQTNTDALLFVMIPSVSLIVGSLIGKEVSDSNNKIKRLQIVEEQLEFLNDELVKKEEKLEFLRKFSRKDNVTDTTIHSIDNSKYKAILQEQLALLAYIKMYRNKLKNCLANGTLTEELKELIIQPENISFVDEAIKRILEK